MIKVVPVTKAASLTSLVFIAILLLSSLTLSAGEPLKSMQIGINLQVRAYLQGPYDMSTGLMKDHLRAQGLLPLQQPYSSSPFFYTGTESLNRSLTSVSLGGDQDALIDWVLLEVRSATNPDLILAQKACGLQADGDLMDVQTGSTTLLFPSLNVGNYHVSLRHRNHLGVVSAQALALSFTSSWLDFSNPNFAVTGQHSRYLHKTKALLWTGDVNQDRKIIAQGISSDNTALLTVVLSANANTAFNTSYRLIGYAATDLNLDGATLAAGPGNDGNLIYSNILNYPSNSSFAGNYIVRGNAY